MLHLKCPTYTASNRTSVVNSRQSASVMPVPAQVAPPGQVPVEPVQRPEQRLDGGIVGGLRGGEACLVHPVVHGGVDAAVQRVHLAAAAPPGRSRRAARPLLSKALLNMRMMSALSLLTMVPVCRSHSIGHGDAGGAARLGPRVELVQERRAAGVRDHAGAGARRTSRPPRITGFTTETPDHAASRPFSRTEDQRAVRPGAGQRDMQVVAPRRRREAAASGRPRAARPASPSCGTGSRCRWKAPPAVGDMSGTIRRTTRRLTSMAHPVQPRRSAAVRASGKAAISLTSLRVMASPNCWNALHLQRRSCRVRPITFWRYHSVKPARRLHVAMKM